MAANAGIQDRQPNTRKHGFQGSPWYQRAYLEERVSRELYRSQRYKTETSIVLIRIPAISRRAARGLLTYVSTQLRTIDMAGMLGTGDYVLCLPQTAQTGGEVVASRIRASSMSIRRYLTSHLMARTASTSNLSS